MIDTTDFLTLPVFERGVWFAARPWLDEMDPIQRAEELELRRAVLEQMGIGLDGTDDLVTMLADFHLNEDALALTACEAFDIIDSDEPFEVVEQHMGLPDGVLEVAPLAVFAWGAEHAIAQLAEALHLPQPKWRAM